MEEFVQEFKVESGSIIETLQGLLMSYEDSTSKSEIAEELFRGVHTLKGTSRMFGFDAIEQTTHQLENTLDEYRQSGNELPRELLDLSIDVLDYCSLVLNDRKDKTKHQSILTSIEQFLHKSKNAVETKSSELYCILYTPAKDVFERGINPLAIFTELEELGDFSYFTHNEVTPLEEQIAKKKLESTFDLWISLEKKFSDLEDVFLFMKENEFEIIPVKDGEKSLEEVWKKIEKQLDGSLSGAEREQRKTFVLDHVKKEEVSLTATPGDKPEISIAPGRAQSASDQEQKLNYINVALPKLDQMMNLVSELVTLCSEAKHYANETGHESLKGTAERLERVSTLFRDNAFSMRLVPIQILSVKLQRYVRELSTTMGKKVRFITEGMDTEIDKAIINEIEAPLMHIIRNAMDHGLENPQERLEKGKSEECLIKISAFYSGTNAFIHIQDDGRGINLEKVYSKAVSSGLIGPNEKLTDNEIISLIFKPGFSTADVVSEVSGRGVGMDVVKKNISSLRGSIEVTTEKDLGTSFAIRLPLTLSIMDVMLVRVGDLNYMFPHQEIEVCTSEKFDSTTIQRKGFNLRYKNELLPFLNLNGLFETKTTEEVADKSIIILNKNDQLLAVEVDEILGKEQVVIKPVDDALQMISYLSGTSILGNGDLAFLIDVLKLKELYAGGD